MHLQLLFCCSVSSMCCWQAARTYLERKFEEFENCSLDQLIRHSLQVRLILMVPSSASNASLP